MKKKHYIIFMALAFFYGAVVLGWSVFSGYRKQWVEFGVGLFLCSIAVFLIISFENYRKTMKQIYKINNKLDQLVEKQEAN